MSCFEKEGRPSDSDDAWMMTHASSVQSRIQNADLRSMPEMLE